MCFTSVVFGRKKESPGPVNVAFAWECAAQIHTHVDVHTPTCVCILQGVSQSQRERLTSVKEVKKCLVTYQKVLHALLALKHCTLWKVFHSGTFYNQLGLLILMPSWDFIHMPSLSLCLSLSTQISTLQRQGRTLFSTVPETAEREGCSLFVHEVILMMHVSWHFPKCTVCVGFFCVCGGVCIWLK